MSQAVPTVFIPALLCEAAAVFAEFLHDELDHAH